MVFISSNWNHFTIFYNDCLLIGRSPIKFGHCSQWYDKWIHSLCDVFGDCGLYSFEELTFPLNLQHSTFDFFLQLRTAMKCMVLPDKVLWRITLYSNFCQVRETRNILSKLDRNFLQKSYVALLVNASWWQIFLTLTQTSTGMGSGIRLNSNPETLTTSRSVEVLFIKHT